VLSFNLELEGKYYFSINQKNRRCFPKSKHYKYSNLHFLAARETTPNNFDYIGANIKADKENWIGQLMMPGKYYVIVKCPWRSFVNEFSFSVYGPDKTDILQISESELPPNFIQNVLISHAGEDSDTKLNSFSQSGQPDIFYKTYDNRGGFGYIYFENKSQDTTLDASVELLGSKNIRVDEPFTGLRPSVVVEPQSVDLIPYEATSLPYSA